MRTLALTLLPLAALAGNVACGSDGGDLPTGSWHPHYGSGGTTGSGSGSGNGATGSSSGSGSSSGAASSSGASSSGSSGSGSGSSGSSSGASSSGSGSSSGGAMNGNPANVAVTVDQASLQMHLFDEVLVHVSVAPNGYRGSVSLATSTMPSGVAGTFDMASLNLDGSTTASAVLTIKTDTSAAPGTTPVDVNAMMSGMMKGATVSLDVQSIITLHIPQGVNNMGGTTQNPVTDAYGPYPITITAPQGLSGSNPVTVYFKNDDTVSHEIHADAGGQGFGHDPGAFGAGQMDPYVRKINSSGTFDFYLHDQGQPITIGRIIVQ